MSKEVYRYTFDPSVSMDDVEESLVLAVVSVESLHGESQAQLDVRHVLDSVRRACVIDAGTPGGTRPESVVYRLSAPGVR